MCWMEIIKTMFFQVLNIYVFFNLFFYPLKGTLYQAALWGFNISLKMDTAKSSEMLEW